MDWTFRNDLPIYTQLMQRLSEGIVSGVYAPGEKLPSVRDFALEAGVNPNTMQRALTDLEREGLVFSVRTSGRFVTENTEMIREAKYRMAEEKAKEFFNSMKKIGCSAQEIVTLFEQMKEEEK